LGKPATWNKYAYVVGDPVNFKDRRGLFYSNSDPNRPCIECEEPEDDPEEDPAPLIGPPLPTPEPTPPVEPGGGSVSKTDAEMRDELMKGLKRAGDILNSNADCAGLFGGGPYPSATTLLAQIDNSFKFGPIDSEAGTVTSATTTGYGSVMYGAVPLNTSVTILLNNTSAGASFVAGNVDDWAVTILHELGHAVYDLYGSYASKITPDGKDTTLSEANTRLIKEKCKLRNSLFWGLC